MKDGRWVSSAGSQFAHEKQGTNFGFRDNRGRWHEVELRTQAHDTLYLIELKPYRGILRRQRPFLLRDGHRNSSGLAERQTPNGSVPTRPRGDRPDVHRVAR